MDFAVGVSPVDFQVPPPQERRTAGSPERAGSWTLGVVGLVQTQQEGTAAASACEQLRDESVAIAKQSQTSGANAVCDAGFSTIQSQTTFAIVITIATRSQRNRKRRDRKRSSSIANAWPENG